MDVCYSPIKMSHYFLALSTNCLRADLIIPISQLTAGTGTVVGKSVRVNQTQLDKQVPNLQDFVAAIE